MSKYTTEVRFLCESLTGNTESKGFNDVDEIITQAAPIIFSFDFPIYDESYRLILEKKILRHYYTREICEETYGLWKLRLEDRLNVIMPYYNQLYRSALLAFNPFYDVDLTTEHAGNQNGFVDTNDVENVTKQNERNTNANENVDEVGNKTGDNRNNREEKKNNAINETGINSNVKVGDNSNVESNNGSIINEHTGTVKDDNIREHNVFNNETNESKSDSQKTGNKDSSYESVNSQNGSTISDSEQAGTNKNTQWDLFSDTPQGGVDGLEVPNTHAPSSLENNLYLTTARKVTNDGATTGTNKQTDVSDSVGTDNGTGNEKNNESSTENIQNNTDRVEAGSANENNVKTYNEKNEETAGNSKENVGNYVESNDGSNARDVKENGNTTEVNEGIYAETNVNNIGRDSSEKSVEDNKENAVRSGSRVSTNTDEYLQKVVGKSGGMSYSSMLLEYRETFINIDEMIIEELSDLFFGLW